MQNLELNSEQSFNEALETNNLGAGKVLSLKYRGNKYFLLMLQRM